METTLIQCQKELASVLVKLGIATVQEAQTKPIEPTKPLWDRFISAVKSSEMSDAMKIACVAQSIIETGRGTSRVAKELNNMWGIKYRDMLSELAEPCKIEVTSEDQGWDIFAKFPSLEVAVKGWLKFLAREYYVGWEDHKNNSEEFLRHIGKAWCPAPEYSEKVVGRIAEARELLSIASIPSEVKTFKIFLDPGHSEREPGARSSDDAAQEEDLNRLQADLIKKGLESTGKFQCTIFDPAVDDLDVIGARARGHDMSLHIHHNSHDGGDTDPGTECLYDNDKAEAQSKKLAEKLSAAISKALGTKDRGAKPFAGTVMDYAEKQGTFPVVLTESFFLNPYNKEEAEERSKKAALAIVVVVKEWFGV